MDIKFVLDGYGSPYKINTRYFINIQVNIDSIEHGTSKPYDVPTQIIEGIEISKSLYEHLQKRISSQQNPENVTIYLRGALEGLIAKISNS